MYSVMTDLLYDCISAQVATYRHKQYIACCLLKVGMVDVDDDDDDDEDDDDDDDDNDDTTTIMGNQSWF